LLKDDKAMMSNPDTWPMWPFLPVKREQPDSVVYETGVMIDLKEQQTTVFFFINFWRIVDEKISLTTIIEEVKRIEYKSIDKLLADG